MYLYDSGHLIWKTNTKVSVCQQITLKLISAQIDVMNAN